MASSQQAALTTMIGEGGSGGVIRIEDHTVVDLAVGAPASATYVLGTDGQASYSSLNSGSGNYTNEWTNPITGGLGGSYEVRATLNSGSLAGGSSATGSWLALSSARSWTVTQVALGNQSANLTIEIRPNAGAVADSCTINLSATWS
jgi:hypothetical protein